MKKDSFLALLNFYRPKAWWHFLGLVLLGSLLNKSTLLFPQLLFKIFTSSLLLAFAFSWNELFDQKQTKTNVFLPLIPIFLIFFIIPFLGLQTKILSLLFFSIAFFYSLPPIRLKSYPFICTFSNAFGFSLLFLMGVSDFKNPIVLPLYLGLLSLLFVAQLIHEFAHLSEDKSENIFTTAIFLGDRKTKILIILFLILASISFLKLSLLIGSISILLAIHITILLHKKNISYPLLRKIYRYAGLAFGIIIFLYLLFISS